MVAIRLEQVDKQRGGSPVLRRVDIGFPSGRVTALVGPSGSGKTTLLRLLAGLDQPDRGRLWWGADDARSLPPHRRSVAMVFQQFVLFPQMTVRENLAFDLRYRRGSRRNAAAASTIDHIAQLLGLDATLDRFPHELSGGEQQRVALGRALASEAEVVLLDEPLAHLDAPLRIELQRALVRWQRARSVTMVYVTHDGDEALGVADQLAVLDAGQVVEVGEPESLLERPGCRTTARWVGTPPANIVRREEAGASVAFAVRPEAIGVAPRGTPCDPHTWCAVGRVVDQCPATGGQAVWIELAPHPSADFAVEGPELLVFARRQPWSIGDRVSVWIEPRRAGRLDAAPDPAPVRAVQDPTHIPEKGNR